MARQKIQIVRLAPMRVASLRAFGRYPERDAWECLMEWAGSQGLLKNRNEHPVFGFNNSRPTRANDQFGYEIWLKVGPEIEPEGPIKIIDFPGGPYAVARCGVRSLHDKKTVNGWKNLGEWCKNNSYKAGYHQALEKFVTHDDRLENLILDLFYPILY